MILHDLRVRRESFADATGWKLEPRGACNGDVCVPLDEPPGEIVDVEAVAGRLSMPLVHDEDHGLWSLGPASIGDRALATAEAPDLRLPDMQGRSFDLSSLRGQKVVLVAWAPF
jgi:hypothetical protein